MATSIKKGQTGVSTESTVEGYAQIVNTPGYKSNGSIGDSGDESSAGAIGIFSEIDNGSVLGSRDMLSPETDDDYRLRVGHDTLLDWEEFDYTAQNTGKHTFTFTTLAATMTAAGLTLNSGNVNTTNIGLTFGSFAMFPCHPTQTLVIEQSIQFVGTPASNLTEDFGLFQRGATTQFAPGDGVYLRVTNGGVKLVINYNGTEIESGFAPISNTNSSPWLPTSNVVYRFLIQVNNVRSTLWLNNIKIAEVMTPVGQNMPFASQALPWSIRRGHSGTTGDANYKSVVKGYQVGVRGALFSDSLSDVTSRIIGSYQGLSGGTMGQLIAGTVTTGTLVKPTAAIPANTSLVANLPNNLGGRIYEQLASGLAANVDGIFASYTVPAGTVAVQGKRLKVTGIKLSGIVSTVVVGGPAATEWYIAFGHTADSLATAESASMTTATTKAPRRIMLPELTTIMGGAAAAGTILVQPSYLAVFANPIYINPGERIALVGNKTITTAITSGVLSFTYQFDYSWE